MAHPRCIRALNEGSQQRQIIRPKWGTRAMRRRQFYSANGFVSENRAIRNFFSKRRYPYNVVLTTHFRLMVSSPKKHDKKIHLFLPKPNRNTQKNIPITRKLVASDLDCYFPELAWVSELTQVRVSESTQLLTTKCNLDFAQKQEPHIIFPIMPPDQKKNRPYLISIQTLSNTPIWRRWIANSKAYGELTMSFSVPNHRRKTSPFTSAFQGRKGAFEVGMADSPGILIRSLKSVLREV
ncbi:hypothetical protein LXL04_004174 [Taraxacum kok-saghyz]